MPTAVDSLQFVLFTSTVQERNSLALWLKAFKSDPLGFNTVPNGLSQSNGIHGPYSVLLQTQLNRVDLVVSAAASHPEDDPFIEDMSLAVEFSLKALSRLIPSLTVERIALIAQRAQSHPDVASAINAIKAALPGLIAPAGAVDLTYQTGVSRDSQAVPGIKLTFLRRWNTGVKKLLQWSVQPGQTLSLDGGREKIISADYVDVFISGPNRLFPKKALALVEELAQAASDLLSEGYGSLS